MESGIEVVVADESHEKYIDTILETISEAASKLEPIEFDQIVPYFRKNCPGGDERKAIVLFDIPVDDETVSVAFMDKVLEKMELWVTTLTRRIYVREVRDDVVEILEIL